MNTEWKRPATVYELALGTHDSESFGRQVRDWQHELRRISSRRAFAERIALAPPLLADKLNDHGQCDAYLAAYVEWLCERHGVAQPAWLQEPERFARKAWYDFPPLWTDSFAHAPGAFRRRGVFTIPEDPLTLRAGRPPVDAVIKKQKSAARQKRYRQRVQEKLARLQELEHKRKD